MTGINSSQKDKDNKKLDKLDNVKENSKNPFWRNAIVLQSCVGIMLTMGLCILILTFYMALQEKQVSSLGHKLHKTEGNSNNEGNNEMSGDVVVGSAVDDVVWNGFDTGDWVDVKRDGRLSFDDIFGHIDLKLNGCQEKLCKIACNNDETFFLSLYKTMKTSSCPSIDAMLVESQVFPDGILKNSWLPMNHSVHEVIIRLSNITAIKDKAFNSPMFTNTLLMSWSKLNIDTVESGALLGLFKLKYLTIDSTVRSLETALFQPVQTTLSHLKLNAHLDLQGNVNPFGITHMNKLEYLDLSLNYINGSLSRRMFSSTPNIKYLIIENSQLQAIRSSAFSRIAKKLIFLNLSKNLLTTLAAESVLPIVEYQKGALLSLGHNKWLCDCNLWELSVVYTNYRNQFMDAVYCSSPRNLYGISINKVKYDEQNCERGIFTTGDDMFESTKYGTTKTYSNTPPMDIESSEMKDSGEVTSTELSNVLKMRCVEPTLPPSSTSSSSESSSPSFISDSFSSSSSSRSSESTARSADDTVLKFPAPEHEFDLHLIVHNNSVKITIENPSDLMIIWFSEQQESSSVTFNDISVDYECMRYAQPNLIVGPLVENTAYTFCLIPRYHSSISPFNCLPLHVPLKRDDNIWISQENKQFTIGMLCLIFLISTIFGAVIAYFGIKTYPDLLEGSKNVLVVKKPEQACYVATISETDYMKNTTLTKRKPSTREDVRMEVPKAATRKKSSIRLPLPATPAEEIYGDVQRPGFQTSHKTLHRVSSDFSSATCFEDTFPECFLFPPDDYETPKICENIYTLEQRMVPNNYNMSPTSPPPLPKRNSNISDSSTLILNRFSKNM